VYTKKKARRKEGISYGRSTPWYNYANIKTSCHMGEDARDLVGGEDGIDDMLSGVMQTDGI
jgi:hypothetical protein